MHLEIRAAHPNFAAQQISHAMKSIVPVLLRAVLTFAVFCGLQYLIPYYLLALGGLVAGFFTLKTSDDRALAIGLLVGSAVFAIFAFVMAQIFPATG